MRLIAIDTAGPVVGVALWCDGQITVRTERIRRGAEARLVPWANALCADAGITLTELDAVAVARGPGAFTGIRVGLGTAVGLALGLGVPLWAGMSLDSRAARLVGAGEVLALLDARKSKVYAAAYRDGARVWGPEDVSPADAFAHVGPGYVATGEGALVHADGVAASGGSIAERSDDPAVDALARLAADGLARGEGIDPVSVEPLYLRAPDARPPSERTWEAT